MRRWILDQRFRLGLSFSVIIAFATFFLLTFTFVVTNATFFLPTWIKLTPDSKSIHLEKY